MRIEEMIASVQDTLGVEVDAKAGPGPGATSTPDWCGRRLTARRRPTRWPIWTRAAKLRPIWADGLPERRMLATLSVSVAQAQPVYA